MITFSTDNGGIDWDEAVEVFLKAPLGKRRRDPEKLQKAFESSYAVVYVFDSDKIIGLGRALCDGQYQAAIYDVVLLPEYQGQGIGAQIMKRILGQLPVDNIILYAVPGCEGFYQYLGFKKMRTAMAQLNQVMSSPESGYLE